MCGIAIALWLSVIKRGCNRTANKIQSPELEPVIYVMCTPRTRHNTYIRTRMHAYMYICMYVVLLESYACILQIEPADGTLEQ
jgi:hypothetical protein